MSQLKNNCNLAPENLKKKKISKENEVNKISEKVYTSFKNNNDHLNFIDGSGIKNLEEKYWLNWKPKQHSSSCKQLKNTSNDNTLQTHRNKIKIHPINEFSQTLVSKSVNCIILPKHQDVSLQTEEIKTLPVPLTLNKKTSTSSIKTSKKTTNENTSAVQNIFKSNPVVKDVIQNKINHDTNIAENTKTIKNDKLHTKKEKRSIWKKLHPV